MDTDQHSTRTDATRRMCANVGAVPWTPLRDLLSRAQVLISRCRRQALKVSAGAGVLR